MNRKDAHIIIMTGTIVTSCPPLNPPTLQSFNGSKSLTHCTVYRTLYRSTTVQYTIQDTHCTVYRTPAPQIRALQYNSSMSPAVELSLLVASRVNSTCQLWSWMSQTLFTPDFQKQVGWRTWRVDEVSRMHRGLTARWIEVHRIVLVFVAQNRSVELSWVSPALKFAPRVRVGSSKGPARH